MSQQQQAGQPSARSSQLKDFLASWKDSDSDDVELEPEELNALRLFVEMKETEAQPSGNDPKSEFYYFVMSRWFIDGEKRLYENRNYPNKRSKKICQYSIAKGDKDWKQVTCY